MSGFLLLTLNDLLFAHWLARKIDIMDAEGGRWQGLGHPNPIPLHVAIDYEIRRLQPT